MECPACGSNRIKVTKTINYKDAIIRHRYCKSCKRYFSTTEVIIATIKELFRI